MSEFSISHAKKARANGSIVSAIIVRIGGVFALSFVGSDDQLITMTAARREDPRIYKTLNGAISDAERAGFNEVIVKF